MKNVWIFLVFSFFGFLCVRAQSNLTVKGVVTDDTGVPIMGASVVVKGTSVGASTGMDGEYSITVPAEGKALEISYIGMITQVITINGQTTIDVQLKEDVSELDEVVVVAYGTQKKSDVTASVQSVSSKELTDITSPDVSTMLQGKASGVQVMQGSGQPGSLPSIRIRGLAAINGNVSPLWVVDGVIVHGTPNLNPNEIESVSVLKDASATSLYGSRGANGVVVVTTKQGKTGKSQLTLSSKTGFSFFNQGNFEVMNGNQLYDYFGKFTNPGNIPDWFSEEVLQNNYNWIDNSTKTGTVQDHTLTFTAGTEKSKTFISLGYYDETGTVKDYEFDRLSFRLNHDYKVNDRLTLKPKFAVNYNTRENRQHSLYQMYLNLPWDAPYDGEGNLINPRDFSGSWYGRDQSNYLYDLQWNYTKGTEFNLYSNFDVEFEILPNLKFISTNSYTLFRSDNKSYTDPQSTSGQAVNGELYQFDSKRITRFTNQMLRYSNTFGDHSINALVAYEYNDYVYESMSATGRGLISGDEVLGNTVTPGAVGGTKNEYALQSVLVNANYGYADRYLAQVSLRRDGASNFGLDNQYGTFYSFSGGWNIHNEDFFNVEAVDQLKLRASYGALGNRPDNLYPQFELYSVDNPYDGRPAAALKQLRNDDLAWEKSYQTNIGLDTRFFNKLNLSLEYYNKNTSDLLYFVKLPASSGYDGYWENIGGVKNIGYEASASFDAFATDTFSWSVGFNIGTNKNEITELFENQDIINNDTKIFRKGEDVNTWYMRKWLGVDTQTGDPLWEVVDPQTGEKSQTSDYNSATRQKVGTASPDFYGGFNTRLAYKGITFSANFVFSKGGKIYNSSRELYDADGAYPTYNQQVLADGWSRWEQPGDEATHPRLVYGGNSLSNKISSRYLEDGSYLRLRNIRVGYTIPQTWLSSVGITNAELYLSGDNLLTFTDFSGMDPEVGVDPDNPIQGVGYYSMLYPVSQRLTLGINLSF